MYVYVCVVCVRTPGRIANAHASANGDPNKDNKDNEGMISYLFFFQTFYLSLSGVVLLAEEKSMTVSRCSCLICARIQVGSP